MRNINREFGDKSILHVENQIESVGVLNLLNSNNGNERVCEHDDEILLVLQFLESLPQQTDFLPTASR